MRLLAFGDSLTAGYHSQGRAFAPWAPALCRMLGVDAIDHIGMSGFTSAQLLKAVDETSVPDVVPIAWPGLRTKMKEHRYDVVLIMCGTNDLDNSSTEDIVNNIAKLHSIAHSLGARTIALTIPESKAASNIQWLRQARNNANAELSKWALSQSANKTVLVDAAKIVPFDKPSVDAGLWEPDGLHWSANGYATFARGLAPMIRDFVLQDCALHSPHDVPLRLGALVRVCGLERATHYNGKTGTVRRMPEATEYADKNDADVRLGVKLDGALEGMPLLSVRRTNLECLL